DGKAGDIRVGIVEVRGSGEKAVAHHQQAVDGFVDARGAERMPGQRFRRRDRRDTRTEYFAYRSQFDDVAERRRGAVRVQIVDRTVHVLECLTHAAHGTFAGRLHHICTVCGHAVADELGVDARAARPRVLERLEDEHAAASGDHETVSVRVIRTGGRRG